MLTMTRTEAIPYDSMKEGMLPLGLGDDPRVPRLPRPCPQGRELHPVHAHRVADDLRHGPRGGQDPARHRAGAQGDAAPPARGHGRRPVRLLHPAPRAELGAGRLRRHAHGHRHHGRRGHPRPGRGAGRARRGLHPDHPGRRRHPRRPGLPREAGRRGRPASHPRTTSWRRPARTPRCTAARSAGSRSAGPRACPIFAQCGTGPDRLRLHARALEPLRRHPRLARRSPPAPRRRRSRRCRIRSCVRR